MKLVIGETVKYHVSHETVHDMEVAILSDPGVRSIHRPKGGLLMKQKALRQAYRYNTSTAHRLIQPSNWNEQVDQDDVFVILMGMTFEKCWPHFLSAPRKHLYIFDAWPEVHDRIVDVAKFYDVDTLMFPSSQVASSFSQYGLRAKCIHVPEGVNASKYRHLPWHQKDIDVLHLGRRYNGFHEKVGGMLQATGRTYLFEDKPGDLIFRDETAFVDGMARTKVSICVPASLTHPEKAGNIETMTQRYLQTMLSKAIPLGYCPDELRDLFGYDPVVRIDQSDPVGQIEDILTNGEKYAALVERNFQEVKGHHTWDLRWADIKSVLHESRRRSAAN